MKITEKIIPPLHVFTEISEEDALFANGLNWLKPDMPQEFWFKGYAHINNELLR